MTALSISDFFKLYEKPSERFGTHFGLPIGLIDVRSESEFEKGSLPGFANLPILTNDERHQVGLTYKQSGQAQAVRLGHELVDPVRDLRVELWKTVLSSSTSGEGVMICWRGGMRSQIAASWAREAGACIHTVVGGIKAIRNELLKSLETLPQFIILSGLTGSGKTELLKEIQVPKIDLESLANHRGSSFGRKMGEKQPSQTTFENALCLELRRNHVLGSTLLLEDESLSIGHCTLPISFKEKMNSSPCVWVESSYEDRALRIYREYVLEPLAKDIPSQSIKEWMTAALQRIDRKLGGLEFVKIRALIDGAFKMSDGQGLRPSHHEEWISKLLKNYYDPLYRYGFNKNVENGRTIAFRGTSQECQQWLQTKFG